MGRSLGRTSEKRSAVTLFAIVFLILLGVMGLILPQGVRSLVIQIMVFSVLAMAYDLSLGFTNQCSLGHSVFFGAGAYGALFSIIYLKVGLLPSLFFSGLAGLVTALFMGATCVRLSEAYFVIVTAIFFAVFHLLAMDLTWLTGGDDGLSVTLPTAGSRIREALSLQSFGQLLFRSHLPCPELRDSG
jgi:branched-chain amino acid transport system permease protein